MERRRSAKPLLRGFDSHLDLHARKAQVAGQVLGKDEMVSSILTSGSSFAGVAREEEQRFCKPKAAGSIPVAGYGGEAAKVDAPES